MHRKTLRRLASLGLAALLAVPLAPARALQIVVVRDGGSEIARISATEATRIKLDRGRIDDLIGDIRVADRNPGGQLIVEPTSDPSEVFVRLARDPEVLAEGEPRRPVNVFVKTSTGKTFGLLLQPVDMPADQIFLRERESEPGTAAPGRLLPQPAGEGAPLPVNANYFRSIKALWFAMATHTAPAGVEIRDVNREMALWREARLLHRRRHVARQWVGDTFELTNVSAEPMLLAEREFDRDGVVFVSIDSHRLAPGESTWVWVVRQRDGSN